MNYILTRMCLINKEENDFTRNYGKRKLMKDVF